MRLKDLYKTEIYDDKRESSFSPLVILTVTLAYIIAVVSFDRYQTLRILPFAAYPVFMGAISLVAAKDLLRKIISVLPFIIFIGVWNPIFDINRTLLFGMTVSMGWISFISLLIKCTLIVSATLIMVAATGLDGLCRTAAFVGVPDVLVTQLFLLQRYIRLLFDETHNVIRARVFRGGKITLMNAGNICGPLLLRSLNRSERIHSALLCRGFDGQLYHSCEESNKISYRDVIFAFFWFLFFVLMRIFDISTIIGDMIVRCVI